MCERTAAKGAAGTVHLYEGDDDAPICGAYVPQGAASSHGAKRRHDVDPEERNPWNLCQDCFPDKYQKYPDNDHWYDVEPRWKWEGTLGSDYTCFVQCNKSECDFIQPARSESEAHRIGLSHKRHPETEAPL